MQELQYFMLILGVGNLSFAALMAAYVPRNSGPRAMGTWMCARLVLGLAQVLSWENLPAPVAVLTDISTLAWVAGMALELTAYCQFFGYLHWLKWIYAGTALSMAVIVAALQMQVPLSVLISIIALIIGLFAGGMGLVLLWPRPGAPALQRMMGVNDTVLALAMAVWAATGYHGDDAVGAGSAIQSFAFLAGYVLLIVKGFGFLLLCKQEDDAKMHHLATVDSLTGMLNRHAFFVQAQTLSQSDRAQTAILMLDLDHFKRINDRFGHAGGDEALRVFADTMRVVLAGRGVFGRLGGEEFALALPATSLGDAMEVGERMRLALSSAEVKADGDAYTMTVSIGVVVLDGDEALASGLARADKALYGAKRSGRNRVTGAQALSQCVEQRFEPGKTRVEQRASDRFGIVAP